MDVKRTFGTDTAPAHTDAALVEIDLNAADIADVLTHHHSALAEESDGDSVVENINGVRCRITDTALDNWYLVETIFPGDDDGDTGRPKGFYLLPGIPGDLETNGGRVPYFQFADTMFDENHNNGPADERRIHHYALGVLMEAIVDPSESVSSTDD